MYDSFQSLAELLRERGIEAEAAFNEAGQVYSLRFYLDGKAYTVHADEGFTLRIDEYEAEEPDDLNQRLDHVLKVLGESGPLGSVGPSLSPIED